MLQAGGIASGVLMELPAVTYIPPPQPEYLSLPHVNIRLFIRHEDLAEAQAAMTLLKGGNTRAMLAAALAVAARYSRGHRIEYADVDMKSRHLVRWWLRRRRCMFGGHRLRAERTECQRSA